MLAYRPRGSTGRWTKTSLQEPLEFAQATLERARRGELVGYTANIVIDRLLDPEVTEFTLLPGQALGWTP